MKKNPLKSYIATLISLLLTTVILNIIIIAAINLHSLFWILALCLLIPLLIISIIGYKQFKQYNQYVNRMSTNLNLKNILYELLEESSRLQTRQALYNLILIKAIQALHNANKGSILKVVDQRFCFEAAIGFDMELLKSITLKKEDTYLYKETNGKMDNTVVIHNSKDYNVHIPEEENQRLLKVYGMDDINTTLSTPIKVEGKIWGMINVDSVHQNAFNEEDIKSFEIFAFEVEKVIKLFDTLEANQYLLNHDTLTKITNRRYFNEMVKVYMNSLNKTGFFCLVSIDLNDLKRINDTYGHHHGDRLLVFFTNAVKKHLRKTDIFARYGGDEFVVLLKNTTKSITLDIINSIEVYLDREGIVIDEHIELITFSYGIVEYPEDGTLIDDLLRNADKKMYDDKQRKRNYYSSSYLEKYNEKLD